jgi:hypothetical protein
MSAVSQSNSVLVAGERLRQVLVDVVVRVDRGVTRQPSAAGPVRGGGGRPPHGRDGPSAHATGAVDLRGPRPS